MKEQRKIKKRARLEGQEGAHSHVVYGNGCQGQRPGIVVVQRGSAASKGYARTVSVDMAVSWLLVGVDMLPNRPNVPVAGMALGKVVVKQRPDGWQEQGRHQERGK